MKKSNNDDDAFREFTVELERLSCLAHEEEKSKHGPSIELWSSVEGCPWSLHGITKPGRDEDYSTAVEVLTESNQNLAVYFTYINHTTYST